MNFMNLTSPHMLSDNKLREILKDRCIEVKDIEFMDKLKLLEIFKRIAMPMPQRKYNDQRSLGKKLSDLRLAKNIKISDHDKTKSELLDKSFESEDKNNSNKSPNNGILKSPINKLKSEQNSIRLSNNIHQVSNDQKRKNNMSPDQSPTKRQKISWP
ncbi:uncharacterized protein LOC103573682 [Microplitis demolitor]|uniref:uncharacterized protein LOC103573682 n=1 Tax=Microplitis demolitor TaxID=69319 RepID=UPI0004CD0381|nr:uncharacterized protein LOC103573682 [Microplitis demolitor]